MNKPHCPKATRLSLVIVCLAVTSSTYSFGQSLSATFNLVPGSSVFTGTGAVTGDFIENGNIATLALSPQTRLGVNGGTANYSGTIDTTIGFDLLSASPNVLTIDNANVVASNNGTWQPAFWNPETNSFGVGFEAGNYAYRVASFVQTVVRDLELSMGSDALAVSNGQLSNDFSMAFTSAFLDLNAPQLGSVERLDLLNDVRKYEVDTEILAPNGNPYPGGIVWREVVGTDGFGNPIYGDLANPFSDSPLNGTGADAVRIFDATGNPLPGEFSNSSVQISTIDATIVDGNIEMELALSFIGTAQFFLGDFLTEFTLDGTLTAMASVAVPGDGNGDGMVTLADFTVWGENFNQPGTGSAMGDYNGDGQITLADFTVWGEWFGFNTGAPSSRAMSLAVVPEPSSVALMLCGAIALILGVISRHMR